MANGYSEQVITAALTYFFSDMKKILLSMALPLPPSYFSDVLFWYIKVNHKSYMKIEYAKDRFMYSFL